MPLDEETEKVDTPAEADPEEVSADEVGEPEPKGTDASAEEGKGRAESQRARDAKAAQLRRDREAKAKAEREAKEASRVDEAYRRGQRDAIRKNPYTNEPIEDDFDLEQYQVMKSIDDRGEDPIAGYPKEVARLAKDRAAKAKEESDAKEKAAKAEKDKYDGWMASIRSSHPDLDTAALARDERFREFCAEKESQGVPLPAVVDWWVGTNKAPTAKPSEKPGSSSPSSVPQGTRSEKSIADMTDDEFIEWRRAKYGG